MTNTDDKKYPAHDEELDGAWSIADIKEAQANAAYLKTKCKEDFAKSPNFRYGYRCGQIHLMRDNQELQKALTEAKSLLAKVCVLEVGAVPIKGDTLEYAWEHMPDYWSDSYGKVKKKRKLLIRATEHQLLHMRCRKPFLVTIYARSGLPVIYKESAVVADNNQAKEGA